MEEVLQDQPSTLLLHLSTSKVVENTNMLDY